MNRFLLSAIATCAALVCLALPSATSFHAAAAQDISLEFVGRYETSVFDESAAEVVAYHAATQQVVFTNANDNSLTFVDVSTPSAPVLVREIQLAAFGGGVNSVTIHGDMVAAAVEAADATEPGQIVLFDMDGTFQKSWTTGALPDMVTFSHDGRYLVSANEGEPDDDYVVDPEGSVTIVDMVSETVTTVGFGEFNVGGPRHNELPADVRIFGPGASVAQDLEPEYVTIGADGQTAWVSLQENNALAVIDLAAGEVVAIRALGFKDWAALGLELDASNRDSGINFNSWPVLGMYQPDAIASYSALGRTFVVTANEGDARDYDGFSEEVRVKDLTLDSARFPDAATLQQNENLGRLKTTTATGDDDGDGLHDRIFAYGARSFSIWDGATGQLVFDSGDEFERTLAAQLPDFFNANNDENDSFDSRSDDKGPEPEAVEIGRVGDRTYAFIGLERVGGVIVYDVTNPYLPKFVTYETSRNFGVLFDEDNASAATLSQVGDSGPEDIVFVPASDSPTAYDMIMVSNEVTGSVALFNVKTAAPEPFVLTVLHNNDGESQLLGLGGEQQGFGGAAAFVAKVRELRGRAASLTGGLRGGVVTVSSGDNYLAGPEFNASIQDGVLYDALVLDAVGYDAAAIGNHEFDFGPDVLADVVEAAANTPFVSANLDVSGEPRLAALAAADRIAPSRVVEKGGERIGIIGAITPNLPFISSPRGAVVNADVRAVVQAEVDRLESEGVNKIILISHLQGVAEDEALIASLRGVDIVVAGGGSEMQANSSDLLIPFDRPERPYPILIDDADGREVPIVTTPGNYSYVGALQVVFDGSGRISEINESFSGPKRVRAKQGVLDRTAGAVAPDPFVLTSVAGPVERALQTLDQAIVATSNVPLSGVRSEVRSRETNLGNLIADALLWQSRERAAAFGVPAPDVAFQNGGGIRNDNVLPAGPISTLTTFDILPFGNFLSVVPDIPATQFKELLENAVSRVQGGGGTGRFAQVAGFRFTYNPAGVPIELGSDGAVVVPGTRVLSAVLDDGTVIIENGAVVAGAPSVTIAIADFLARGGDQYPFRGAPFTRLGLSDQQTLAAYLESGLGGEVTAAAYPEGGEGRIQTTDVLALPGGALAVSTEETALPGSFSLEQNYPNPFAARTTIAFELPESGMVRLSVYDLMGREVTRLVHETLPAGRHEVTYVVNGLPSGVYVYQLETAGSRSVRQMTRLR